MNFRNVTAALGYDVDAAIRRAGLPPRVLKEPDLRLPVSKVAWLLEDAAQATGCSTIGLRMVPSRKLSNLGPVSLLLAYQATLRDMLTATIDHLHLLNDALVIHIEDAGALVIIHEEIMTSPPVRQSVELALGVLHGMCTELIGPLWRPKSVHFSHDAPPDLSVHRAIFPCVMMFNSTFNGVVCRASDLAAPNSSADPRLVCYAETLLEQTPRTGGPRLSDEVRRMIYAMLPSGRVTCESIARGLGRSLRTLQRELDEEGINFTTLLTEARRSLAQRYVINSHHRLDHVADLLGYSTHSAFTRWFKAEFGQSPAALRRQSSKHQKS